MLPDIVRISLADINSLERMSPSKRNNVVERFSSAVFKTANKSWNFLDFLTNIDLFLIKFLNITDFKYNRNI